MKIIKDITCGIRFPYNLLELLKARNWFRELKYRKQRIDRGWSDKDTWGGGEYIMEVTAGILNYLQSEKGYVDWDEYFKCNYPLNCGYKSLNEVAQDLENYLAWEKEQYSHPIFSTYDIETRWAIENQLYSNAQDALLFISENVGQLWD